MNARYLIFVLLFAGCAARQEPVVYIRADSRPVTKDGGPATFTPSELDQAVRKYASERRLGFDFRACTVLVTVLHSQQHLAEVLYTPEKEGQKALTAYIGFDGAVTSYQVNTAVFCATRLANSPAAAFVDVACKVRCPTDTGR